MKAKRNGYKDGMRAAQEHPDNYEQIGMSIYRGLCHERVAEVKKLNYEGSELKAQEEECTASLNGFGNMSFSAYKLSFFIGILSLLIALLFLFGSYFAIRYTLGLVFDGSENLKILAASLALGTTVGFHWTLHYLVRHYPQQAMERWILFISVTTVFLFLSGVPTLSLIRSHYEATKSYVSQSEEALVVVEGVEVQTAQNNNKEVLSKFYEIMKSLVAFLIFVATLGLELLAALNFHESFTRLFPSLEALRMHRRLVWIRKRMVKIAQDLAEVQAFPERYKEEFFRGALEANTGQDSSYFDQVPGSVSPLTVGLIAYILILVLIFGVFLNHAYSAEFVAVAVDDSGSSKAMLESNIAAVDDFISQLKPGSRLVVIPINEHSFSSEKILDARITAKPGLFGEKLKASKRVLRKIWRSKSKGLTGEAKSSDVLGAGFKAAALFAENPEMQHTLIYLGDMQIFDRGITFQKYSEASNLLKAIENKRLIPDLKNVQVWVLGVHTNGVADADLFFMALKDFYTKYFEKAGAAIKMFSQSRRWNYE